MTSPSGSCGEDRDGDPRDCGVASTSGERTSDNYVGPFGHLVGNSGTLVRWGAARSLYLKELLFHPFSAHPPCPFFYKSFAGRATSPRRSKLSVAGTVVGGSSSPISSGPPISKNPPG